jgi:hypothetical protein
VYTGIASGTSSGLRLRWLADGEDLLQPFPRRCRLGLAVHRVDPGAIDWPALQPVDEDVDDHAGLDLLLTSELLDHRIPSVYGAPAGGVAFRNAPQVRTECRFTGRQQPPGPPRRVRSRLARRGPGPELAEAGGRLPGASRTAV